MEDSDQSSLYNLEALFSDYELKLAKLSSIVDLTRNMTSDLSEFTLVQNFIFSFYGQFICSNLNLLLRSRTNHDIFEIAEGSSILHSSNQIEEYHSNLPMIQFLNQKREIFPNRSNKTFISFELRALLQDKESRQFLDKMQSEVVIPLWGKKMFYGILFLGSKLNGIPYSREDLRQLYDFTTIMGSSIENARLFYYISTDMMTGVFNKQFCINHLERNLQNLTQKDNQNLYFTMIDIDNFKSVNDTYGHLAGDFVLVVFAKLMMIKLQDKQALVSRYGGEEFSIIFTETSLQEVIDILNIIREELSSYIIKKDEVEFSITASFGVYEVSPQSIEKVEKIIEKADTALYYSKHNGKNQINVYTPQLENAIL